MMTSAPPSPSIVALPEPAVIVLAPVDPMIDIALDTSLASTLAKSLIVEPPEVAWFVERARFKLTALCITSVFTPPTPPSIEDSEPWK